MALRFSPELMRLPHQARATVADAARLMIRLADTTGSYCVADGLRWKAMATVGVGWRLHAASLLPSPVTVVMPTPS
jgi:hypothetical protein